MARGGGEGSGEGAGRGGALVRCSLGAAPATATAAASFSDSLKQTRWRPLPPSRLPAEIQVSDRADPSSGSGSLPGALPRRVAPGARAPRPAVAVRGGRRCGPRVLPAPGQRPATPRSPGPLRPGAALAWGGSSLPRGRAPRLLTS